MRIPRTRPRVGMPARNLRSSCRIQATPPTLCAAVSSGLFWPDLFTSFGLHRCLVLTHKIDAHHRFIAEECDWGFTRFHDLRKLFTGIDGRRPIIENDESEITVFVRVLKDPTGVLWHNFVKYVTNASCPHHLTYCFAFIVMIRRKKLDMLD